MIIPRDKYLHALINNRSNGFPKVITGIRRCGKSFLIKEIFKSYLLDNGLAEDQILIVELDDDRNIHYRDPLYLASYVREFCKDKENCVVFLDEIQLVYTIVNPNLTDGKHILAKKDEKEIVSFVDVVLGLSREKNIDLYLSGSNSRMLSTDIVTQFRDKAVNIEVHPLSFSEFYQFKKENSQEALYEYMQYGGMPLAILKSEDEKREYLKNLFELTYFKDIIERNRIRKSAVLDELCNILSGQTSNLVNSQKISNTYKSIKKEEISANSIDTFISYFIEAFLIKEARRYDIKGKREIGALKKYYFSDTGLRNARLNLAFVDEGPLLENIVYNELIYYGYSVNVGSFDSIIKDQAGKSIRQTNEIDFFARRGTRQYYIQVTNDISSAETRAREYRPYLMLKDQIRKIIVVNKPIKESLDEYNFTIIGITEFLLSFIK